MENEKIKTLLSNQFFEAISQDELQEAVRDIQLEEIKNELIKIQKLLETMKNNIKIESENLKKFIMNR